MVLFKIGVEGDCSKHETKGWFHGRFEFHSMMPFLAQEKFATTRVHSNLAPGEVDVES